MKKVVSKKTKIFAVMSSIVMVMAIVLIAVFSAGKQMIDGNNVINILNAQKANVDVQVLELSNSLNNKMLTQNNETNTLVFTEKFNYKRGDKAESLNSLKPVHFDKQGDVILYKIIINNLEENKISAKLFFKGISNKKIKIMAGSTLFSTNNVENFDDVSKFDLLSKGREEIYVKIFSNVNANGKNVSKNINFFNMCIEVEK